MKTSDALRQLGLQILDIDGNKVVAKEKIGNRVKYHVLSEIDIPDANYYRIYANFLLSDNFIVRLGRAFRIFKLASDKYPIYLEEQYIDKISEIERKIESNEMLDPMDTLYFRQLEAANWKQLIEKTTTSMSNKLLFVVKLNEMLAIDNNEDIQYLDIEE